METRRVVSVGKPFKQLDLFDNVLPKHDVWQLSCTVCQRYRQKAIGRHLAGIKAQRHIDKYNHTVVGDCLDTNQTVVFSRKYEVKDVDEDDPPY